MNLSKRHNLTIRVSTYVDASMCVHVPLIAYEISIRVRRCVFCVYFVSSHSTHPVFTIHPSFAVFIVFRYLNIIGQCISVFVFCGFIVATNIDPIFHFRCAASSRAMSTGPCLGVGHDKESMGLHKHTDLHTQCLV